MIIEGVSTTRQAFLPFVAFTIWVETDRSERLRRGLVRDGEQMANRWAEWMAEEDSHVAAEHRERRADILVSGERS